MTSGSAPNLGHEMLHYLRTCLEFNHNARLFLNTVHGTHSLRLLQHDSWQLPNFSLETATEFCNRAAPIYILGPNGGPRGVRRYLIFAILHYVYRRWFRPYRNDIEYGQFLVKFVAPYGFSREETTSLSDVVDLVKDLHAAICLKVNDVQSLAQQLVGHDCAEQSERLGPKRYGPTGLDMERFILGQEFFILQPLFRAIALIVCDFDLPDVENLPIQQLPILIARTGVEDGLSAPVTFDSIADEIEDLVKDPSGGIRAVKTTLQTAVTFLLALQLRETRAFGPSPDPAAYATKCWNGWFSGEETLERRDVGMSSLVGPSSEWVDLNMYPVDLGPEWVDQNNVPAKDDPDRLMFNMAKMVKLRRGLVRQARERAQRERETEALQQELPFVDSDTLD